MPPLRGFGFYVGVGFYNYVAPTALGSGNEMPMRCPQDAHEMPAGCWPEPRQGCHICSPPIPKTKFSSSVRSGISPPGHQTMPFLTELLKLGTTLLQICQFYGLWGRCRSLSPTHLRVSALEPRDSVPECGSPLPLWRANLRLPLSTGASNRRPTILSWGRGPTPSPVGTGEGGRRPGEGRVGETDC